MKTVKRGPPRFPAAIVEAIAATDASGASAASAACDTEVRIDDLDKGLERWGFRYGTSFRAIERVWHGGRQVVARLHLPPALAGDDAYGAHPCLLDACLRIVAVPFLFGETARDERSYVPFGLDVLRIHRKLPEALWCHAHLLEGDRDARGARADVRAFDEAGELVVEALGFRLRLAQEAALKSSMFPPPSAHTRSAAHAALGIEWHAAPLDTVSPASARARAWVVVAPDGDRLARAFEDLLVLRGEHVVRSIETATMAGSFSHVVFIAGDEAAAALVTTAVELVQTIVRLPTSVVPRLTIVTRSTQATSPGSTVRARQAGLWGLGRVIGSEHRMAWGGLVDLELEPVGGDDDTQALAAAARDARHLLDELDHRHEEAEDHVAYREGMRLVPRLVSSPRTSGGPGAPPSERAASLRDDATYLITGGLGGLGLVVAEWMVDRGARHLALLSRSTSPRAHAAVERLRMRGCEVTIALGDVSRDADVARVIATLDASMPPLAGIVHAAGVLSDASIQNQSAEKIQSVFAPKVDGARYLDAHTARHGLDFFVLFSSVSALIGMPGQANYAAANAFLDAFAHERQAAGRPTYSINWGRWDRVGVGASLASADARVRARWDGWGLVATSPADGLRALERALSARAPQAVVLPLERPKFLAGFPGARRGSLFRAFDVDPPSLGGHPRTGFLASVAAAPPSARSELFLALVRGEVGRVLGQSEDIPDDRKPLAAGGVDSLMAIELGNTLGTILHRSLPATLVFNYPTIAELAAHLEQAWDRRKARESAPVATTPIDHEAALLAEIESLSDGEAEAELEYELSPESKRK